MANCLTLKKSNCKNCYKCIRHCPVKAIRFSGNQAHIIGNECILCGHCFVVCPQNAKEIVDSTEKVRVLLQSGDPVIVSLAPSFVANYDGVGIDAMRKALQKLGFADVEETAIDSSSDSFRFLPLLLFLSGSLTSPQFGQKCAVSGSGFLHLLHFTIDFPPYFFDFGKKKGGAHYKSHLSTIPLYHIFIALSSASFCLFCDIIAWRPFSEKQR